MHESTERLRSVGPPTFSGVGIFDTMRKFNAERARVLCNYGEYVCNIGKTLGAPAQVVRTPSPAAGELAT